MSPFVGCYLGAIGDLDLPGVDRPKSAQGMPLALSLRREGEDITLSFGGYSFAFADDSSRFHLLERSETALIAREAGFLRAMDGGIVVHYSRFDHDGAKHHFRLLLFRKDDGVLIATLLTARGDDALSLWGSGELGPVGTPPLDETLPSFEISPIPVPKSKVFFAEGEAELSPLARRILDYQTAIMKAAPRTRFKIVGHTDTLETSDRNASFGLAYRRAAMVRDYLVGKGIAKWRLRIEGRGSESVIPTNDSETSMAGMRFVDTRFGGHDR